MRSAPNRCCSARWSPASSSPSTRGLSTASRHRSVRVRSSRSASIRIAWSRITVAAASASSSVSAWTSARSLLESACNSSIRSGSAPASRKWAITGQLPPDRRRIASTAASPVADWRANSPRRSTRMASARRALSAPTAFCSGVSAAAREPPAAGADTDSGVHASSSRRSASSVTVTAVVDAVSTSASPNPSGVEACTSTVPSPSSMAARPSSSAASWAIGANSAILSSSKRTSAPGTGAPSASVTVTVSRAVGA